MPNHQTEQLFAFAREIGLECIGVCRAETAATYPFFERWLDEKKHGDTSDSNIEHVQQNKNQSNGMTYLHRYREARKHPKSVLPDVKSLVMVAVSYESVNPPPPILKIPSPQEPFGIVAEYARGNDYHDVIRAKLKRLAEKHRELFPNAITRIAVDSAPILEREYAMRAGLGRIGKNTLLINEQFGSRFFLGVLLSSAELFDKIFENNHVANIKKVAAVKNITKTESTANTPNIGNANGVTNAENAATTQNADAKTPRLLPPRESACENCGRCVEACPVHALDSAYQLDARKCLNYWLIEFQGNEIPPEIRRHLDRRLFGCDTCIRVCPFNQKRFQTPTTKIPADEFQQMSLREQLEHGYLSLAQIECLDEATFRKQFSNTPIFRLGLMRLKRNVC